MPKPQLDTSLADLRPFGRKQQFGKAVNSEYKPKTTTVKLEPLDLTVNPDWKFRTITAGNSTYVICPKCNCWTARRGVPCDHDLSTPIPEAIQRAGVYVAKRKPSAPSATPTKE